MSVSLPSWLLGNTCTLSAPLVSSLIALAISRARMFIGWLMGRLLANFSLKSAARLLPLYRPIPAAATAADASEAVLMKERRVKSLMKLS
ncbi:hypothetical protein D3C76_1639660 [compost metagenome]